MRATSSGDMVASFSLAYTKKRKGEESTTWFRCTAFGKTAEIVERYVSKGAPLLIEGEITSRKYTDKNGLEKESWDVAVNNLVLLGSKRDGEAPSKPSAPASAENFDDDIPF
jgi:single-strand DNA-binding protein